MIDILSWSLLGVGLLVGIIILCWPIGHPILPGEE
jgi:hypothetical protein